MGLFRRKRVDSRVLKRKIAEVIIDLKQLHKRAYVWRARLEERIRDYEIKLKYETIQEKRVAIANSIAMYKRALRLITNIEVALELLLLRVETLNLLRLTGNELVMIKTVLRDIRKFTEGFPDISVITEDLVERVNDLIQYLPALGSSDYVVMAENEAKKILEEAKVLAEERLKESISS
ncbi:MAG: hypothetical protein J7L12_00035 [Desulfurococcales archaeon]|nr:hypothetical protein [Desulfurococcales archaeon]